MDPRQGSRLALRAVRAWSDDYAPSMGAALSYYTLFSIAPLLLIVIGIAGYFFGEQAARGEIYGEIASLIGPDGAHAIEGLVASARKPESGILSMIIGTALLVTGASTVFGELQNALDRIWRAPARQQKGWWTLIRTRLASFGMIFAIAFLLMISLVVSATVSALGNWYGHFFDLGISFVLITVLFAMIYKILPRVRIAWSDVWVGAAVTSALFAAGKWAIGLYLGKTSVASAFGAAGSLVVVMVWVYYSAQIFLLGAEFTRLYAEEQGSRAAPSAPRAIRVQPAANTPIRRGQGAGRAFASLGVALAMGVVANMGLNFWRRR